MNEIDKTKRAHWEDWLESITDETLWKAHKYATTDYATTSASSLLPLQDTTTTDGALLTTNADKSQALYRVFFPSQDVRQEEYDESSYPEPAFPYRTIWARQIVRAINRLSPFKAPGPDGIPNAVIMQSRDLLVPYLLPLI